MLQLVGLIVGVYSLIRLAQAPTLVPFDRENPSPFQWRVLYVSITSAFGLLVIGVLTAVLLLGFGE